MKYRTTKLVKITEDVYEARTQDNDEVIHRGTLQECDIAATDFILKQINYDLKIVEQKAKELFEKNTNPLNIKPNNNDYKDDNSGESSIS